MSERWDLEFYNQENQLVLAVEVKSKLNASIEWASQLRMNLLSHGKLLNPQFFLMVFPDRFVLWKDSPISHEPIDPTFTSDASSIFKPYLDIPGVKNQSLDIFHLETIVSSWLNLLIIKKPDQFEPFEKWVIDYGLYESLLSAKPIGMVLT